MATGITKFYGLHSSVSVTLRQTLMAGLCAGVPTQGALGRHPFKGPAPLFQPVPDHRFPGITQFIWQLFLVVLWRGKRLSDYWLAKIVHPR